MDAATHSVNGMEIMMARILYVSYPERIHNENKLLGNKIKEVSHD